MRKPLVIIDHDEEIKKLMDALETGHEMYKTSIEFLKKQIEESRKKLIDSVWDDIEKHLLDRNMLPDTYSKDRHSLAIKDGVLYLDDNTNEKNIFELLLNGGD